MTRNEEMTTRNTVTIEEMKTHLTAEHSGAVLRGRVWWEIIPQACRWQESGDASGILQLFAALDQLAQPAGFAKQQDRNGKLRTVPLGARDALIAILKKDGEAAHPPVEDAIRIRAKYTGADPEKMIAQAWEIYHATCKSEHTRIARAADAILKWKADTSAPMPFLTSGMNGFDEPDEESPTDGHEYIVDWDEIQNAAPSGEEVLIPIDAIIKTGEGALTAMAKNPRIKDEFFAQESFLWESEIAYFKTIIQMREHEGANEGSRAIDDAGLTSADMHAGSQAGK